MVFIRWIVTFVAEETLGLFLWWSRHDGSDNVAGKWHHDDQEEQNLGLNKAEYTYKHMDAHKHDLQEQDTVSPYNNSLI